MTVEHEGLSVNKSIHPIMDIFGQLLFRLAVPRRSFTEVQYFVRRLPQSRGVKEYIRCLSIHFKLRVIVSDNAGCPSIGRLLYCRKPQKIKSKKTIAKAVYKYSGLPCNYET